MGCRCHVTVTPFLLCAEVQIAQTETPSSEVFFRGKPLCFCFYVHRTSQKLSQDAENGQYPLFVRVARKASRCKCQNLKRRRNEHNVMTTLVRFLFVCLF